jgi:dGTPase
MSDPHTRLGTIRELLEEREKNTLSPFATLSAESNGRQIQEPDHPYRMPFQRDRDRILHTKAFRRLKGKTQVFLAPKGDHYRTRLTHTLEVSQISRTAARALSLNEDLVEAIALGHDLGHTPFGHAGESVLNELYPEGFRHFEQSLRVVDELESTTKRRGLNLTQEVRDGILHHSMGKVILLGRNGPMASTLEGRVVSICDAIAYINHDIDDAIRAGVISISDLPKDAIQLLGDTSSARIGTMVTGLIEGSHEENIDLVPDVKEALNALRDFLYANLYPGEAINKEISKAKRILKGLYEYLNENPLGYIADYPEGASLERKVVDRLAGMTDQYALEMYQKLFFPESWPA